MEEKLVTVTRSSLKLYQPPSAPYLKENHNLIIKHYCQTKFVQWIWTTELSDTGVFVFDKDCRVLGRSVIT